MYNYPEPFFFRGYSQPYGVSRSSRCFPWFFPSVLLSVFFLLFKIDCRFLLPSFQQKKNKASLPKRKLHRTRKGTRDARKRGGSNELGTKPAPHVSTQTKRKWMSQNEREMKKSDQTNQSASDSFLFRPLPFSRCPVFYITPFPPTTISLAPFPTPLNNGML
jgi:hypothetical protein